MSDWEWTPDDGGEPICYWQEDMRPCEVREVIEQAYARGKTHVGRVAEAALNERDEAFDAMEQLCKERDEARAEVTRLREALENLVDIAAYRARVHEDLVLSQGCVSARAALEVHE